MVAVRKDGGRDSWESEMDTYTLLYLRRILTRTSCITHGTQLKVMRLDGKGAGGERVRVYVWLRPCTAHLKLSQYCLLIGYTPEENKRLKKIESTVEY